MLAPGKKADVNVIDFDGLTLRMPRVARDLPAGGARLLQEADGYVATMVSGEITRRHGVDTGARPGRLLRAPADPPPGDPHPTVLASAGRNGCAELTPVREHEEQPIVTHPDDEFHRPTNDDPFWSETVWFRVLGAGAQARRVDVPVLPHQPGHVLGGGVPLGRPG